MSSISEIYRGYRDALRESQARYEELYLARAKAAREFYRAWFYNLIITYPERWQNRVYTDRIRRSAEVFFGRREVDFCAIDGSCFKDPFTDFMVFFGASYGVKGRLSLTGSPPRLKYERWSMDQDVSMVAYVPIPLAHISDAVGGRPKDQFLVSEEDKVNLANIHTKIMQLAEVYLAYHVASASAMEYPRLIMMDHSLSSIFSSVERGLETIGLIGYQLGQRRLSKRDVVVALSRPYSRELGIPSAKHFSLRRRLIAELTWNKGRPVDLSEFSRREKVDLAEVRRAAEALAGVGRSAVSPPVAALEAPDRLSVAAGFDPELAWYDVLRLFEDICYRLFLKKDQSALIYTVRDDDGERRRWMSPDDLDFLIAVGMRGLIERCWEKRILLVGIAKDSATRFFSRHYLGVLRHVGVYPNVDVGPLPWTDRVFLEALAQSEPTVAAPWSTVEFDGVFMTLHLEEDPRTGRPEVRGMRGWVVLPPERLFLRSLAQFYLVRRSGVARMGHVIFVDRLAHPHFDGKAFGGVEVTARELGTIKPVVYLDSSADNQMQDLMMFFLDVLTRNLYPEVIGYPDPLHKADWGAKTLKRRARDLIRSSETAFRIRPISRLFRSMRDEAGR
ncbi:MAG TPA: hypothetical protein DCL13_00180 [Peptococcaceae bacterium]|nr:hypothetical protein [Peptococcaceae bacterium]